MSSTKSSQRKAQPSTAGLIDHRILDEDIDKYVKEFEAQGKPIKYNMDGSIQKTQFNHLIRTKRRIEARIRAMDIQKATKELEEKLKNTEITDEMMVEFGKKVQAGEISMEEAKKVLLYKFERDPLFMCRRLFRDMTIDRSTGLSTPSPIFHKELLTLYLKHNRLAIAAPRGHAKSTVTGFFYILHQALFQKKKNIVIVSATEDLAIRFLRDIKTELEVNKELLWLFGQQESKKWSEKEIQLNNGCRIYAKGRGGQMRGLKERGTRPDLIVLDDLEDSEIVRSETRRLDLEEWFNGDVLPTLEPSIGQVIVIGTILHMDSLLSRLLDNTLYPDFTTRRYGAILSDGMPLWPERFSLDLLNQIKASYIARGQLSTFFMEYMNDPVPDEGATFTQSMIQYYDQLPNDPFSNDIVKELFIDLGGGGLKKTADPTAMVVVATDRETGNIYIDDYVNKRMGTDTDLIISNIFTLTSNHNIRKIYIEKTQAANLLASSLDRALRASRQHFTIEYISPTKGSGDRRGNMSDGKFQRIAQMEAPFRTGTIKIRRWMTDLVEQLIAFPRGQHDDLLDAIAYAFMFAKKKRKSSVNKQFIPSTRRGYMNRNYGTY